MTKLKLKNMLVKKPSYLRWSAWRVMDRFMASDYSSRAYAYTTTREAMELAKKSIKKSGGSY